MILKGDCKISQQSVQIGLNELKAINSLLLGGEPNGAVTKIMEDLCHAQKDGNSEIVKQKMILSVGLLLKDLRKIDESPRFKSIGETQYRFDHISHSFIMDIVVVRKYKVTEIKNGEYTGDPQSGYEEVYTIDEFESLSKVAVDPANGRVI
jgi:hypothetical protein